MREIKFRLFSKVAQSIIEWDQVKKKPHLIWDTERYTAMQFTGRTDSKGVEIYGGYILLYIEELEGEYVCGQKLWYLKVIWENDGWYLLSGCEEVGGKFEEFTGLEVIGNIHENPELLEATK